MNQLREEFASAPTTQREYMIEGKKYIVTRHFAGDIDLDTVIRVIAVNSAYKDMRL